MKKNKKKNKISSNKAQENIMTKVTEPYFDKENLAKIVESYFNNGQENVAALDEEMKNTSAQLSKNLDSLNKKISAAQVAIIKPEILKPTDIEESLLNSSDISEVKQIDMSDIKAVSKDWDNIHTNVQQLILQSLTAEKKAELFSILNSQKEKLIDISDIKAVSKDWDNIDLNIQQFILKSISLIKKVELFSILNSKKKYKSCIEILKFCLEQDIDKQLEDFIELFYGLEADKGLYNMNHNLQNLYGEKTYINVKNLNKGCDKFNILCDQITNILKNCTPKELSKVHHELTHENLVEKMNEVYESCFDGSFFEAFLFINWLQNSTKASTAQTIFLDWACAPEAKELIDKAYSISPDYIKQSVFEILENKNNNSSDEQSWNNMTDKKKKKAWKTLDKDKKMKYFNEVKPDLKIKFFKTIMNDPDANADEITCFLMYLKKYLPKESLVEALKDSSLSYSSIANLSKFAYDMKYICQKKIMKRF